MKLSLNARLTKDNVQTQHSASKSDPAKVSRSVLTRSGSHTLVGGATSLAVNDGTDKEKKTAVALSDAPKPLKENIVTFKSTIPSIFTNGRR